MLTEILELCLCVMKCCFSTLRNLFVYSLAILITLKDFPCISQDFFLME